MLVSNIVNFKMQTRCMAQSCASLSSAAGHDFESPCSRDYLVSGGR